MHAGAGDGVRFCFGRARAVPHATAGVVAAVSRQLSHEHTVSSWSGQRWQQRVEELAPVVVEAEGDGASVVPQYVEEPRHDRRERQCLALSHRMS